MNLKNLKKVFENNGCSQVYVKTLSANDNSKNQVYFGGSFEILNILPIVEITTEEAGDWQKERFKANINFSWIADDGNLYLAPNSQLILYPKYPEVRFSGFLLGCKNKPSELMTQRLPGRLLFFSVKPNGEIIGYVVGPDSEIAREYNQLKLPESHGVFKVLEIADGLHNREKLLLELKRIHELGWIQSKRLDSKGIFLPCEAPNCGGYTLEAELGISANGYSEPDYLGWEVKQFNVSKFNLTNSAIITLMTPEPTDGIYKTSGADTFIREYGYLDKSGKPDRMNFGGIHKVGLKHHLTNLTMELIGFDESEGKIRNTNGSIALIDVKGNEAASWSFASMLKHWNRKHNKACYVPSMSLKNKPQEYQYGKDIILGTGTDFQLFLQQMALGNIYYDPGIKLENMSTKPKIKKRSQFRIKSQNLPSLYKENEIVDVTL